MSKYTTITAQIKDLKQVRSKMSLFEKSFMGVVCGTGYFSDHQRKRVAKMWEKYCDGK